MKRPSLESVWNLLVATNIADMHGNLSNSGLILHLHPANERRRYKVTPSLIGLVQNENQPWNFAILFWLNM